MFYSLLAVLSFLLVSTSTYSFTIVLPAGIQPRRTQSTFQLDVTPRQPRRNLKKRPRENNNNRDDFPWETAESKPLILAQQKELGEDYWMDEAEIQREQARQRPPKKLPGQVTDEKLWKEVLSPYQQNWIGWISVLFVVFSAIITNFPELLDTPRITIPDL